jgi:ferrous iron transport protein A
LLTLAEGQKARISTVTGTASERSRLCALGFTPGTEVEVSHCGGGQHVRIRNTCLVLDQGTAGSIVCRSDDAECRRRKPGKHRHGEKEISYE